MNTTIYTAILLALLLIGTSASTHDASQPTNDASTQCSNGSSSVQSSDATQGPADWESIGHTLGCVFAPHTCESKK